MSSSPKCRAEGGVLNCKRSDCPEKQAARADFFADLPAAALSASDLPSFASEAELVAYVAKEYGGKVKYEVARYEGRYGYEYLSVNKIVVAPELRGRGIALRIRRMLQQYADSNELIITGDPTDQGDGTVVQDRRSKAYKEHCIAHRARLVRAYFTTGYCHNPFFDYRNSGFWKKSGGAKDRDPLTGNFAVRDFEVRSRFGPRGYFFLEQLDEFVYFPNGRIPQWMLEEGADDRFASWQRPEDASSREEQKARHLAQYQAQLARS